MKAVISSTYDDLYLFYLPIVAWSWNKIGIDVICFLPYLKYWAENKKLDAVIDAKWNKDLKLEFYPFEAPDDKLATYAQCSRLYAAALPELPDNEILITGDVDMAAFHQEYFEVANNGQINIFGIDLVPPNQYPICYITMPAKKWREVMEIKLHDTHQECLDGLLGHLECEHFKGNYWAKDQETIYERISNSDHRIVGHYRAKYPHQFATHRADRDGWPDTPDHYIIDAHLPRPGYTDENFAKILKLFQDIYPNEDFTWMIEYKNQYVKLLKEQNE